MSREAIHVAVGVIYGPDGRILISRRAADAHQGGLWEFPGGKVEANESVTDALARELREELAIRMDGTAQPLCKVQHDYGDKQVLLDVWSVRQFSGEATGLEGQPLRWVHAHELLAEEFPVANRAIIRCLRLSDRYLISPALSDAGQLSAWLHEHTLDHPGQQSLLQIRLPSLDRQQFQKLVSQCLDALPDRRHIMVNGDPDSAWALQMGGCHLSSKHLMSHTDRPVPDGMLLGASCHNEGELEQAERVGADYALLSPVAATASHPEQSPMGWETFRELCSQVNIPVYALGGMQVGDLGTAQENGARGIAGITLGTQLR